MSTFTAGQSPPSTADDSSETRASDGQKSERPARIFIPFFALSIVSVLAILVFLFNTAREIDRVAVQASTDTVSSVLRINQQEVATLVEDYSWWDEAIANLLLSRDQEWLENNIDAEVLEDFGLGGLIAIDHSLSPVHVIETGEGSDDSEIAALIEKLHPFIEGALQAPMTEPMAQTGTTMIGSDPNIVSVSALTPVDPPLPGYGPQNRGLLIGWRPINQAFLEQLATAFNLINPVFSPVAVGDHPAAIPLNDFDGSALGYIKWDAARPGHEYLLSSLWIIGLLLILIVGVSAILYR